MVTKKRPLVVSIFSWYLIIGSVLGVLFIPFFFLSSIMKQAFQDFGVPIAKIILVMLLHLAISVTAGITMLNRYSWGRRLYLYAYPLVMLLTVFLYGLKHLPTILLGFVMYVVFVVLLTRRKVSDYFTDSVNNEEIPIAPTETGVKEISNLRKACSIILLMLGGFTVNAWLMVLLPLSSSLLALVITSCIFGFFACAFIIPAVFMWDRKRCAVVLGSLFTTAGVVQLFMALMFIQAKFMPVTPNQMAISEPMVMEQMLYGTLISGLAEVGLGVLLIAYQKKKDKKAKDTIVPA